MKIRSLLKNSSNSSMRFLEIRIKGEFKNEYRGRQKNRSDSK